MRVVIDKGGMLEMTIINVIFLTNVENCFRVLFTSLLPSDMTLTRLSAHISGYNTDIFVATKDMAPGQNNELNAEKLPLTMASSTDKPSILTSSHASQRGESQTEKPADAQKLLTQASVAEELERPSHESTKSLLTVASFPNVSSVYRPFLLRSQSGSRPCPNSGFSTKMAFTST